MEFEPFHSDEDDASSFMPEKKKNKDDKRRKNKGSLKGDKKDKTIYNDGSTPTTMKTKNVHGLVGPAEYIIETSPTPIESPNIYAGQATSPTNAVTSQKTANQIFSQQQQNLPSQAQHVQQGTPNQWSVNTQYQQQPQLQPPSQQQTSTPVSQWSAANAPHQSQLQQSQQQQAQPFKHQSNSTPNFQHIKFPNTTPTASHSGNFNISTKVERPHSSAAMIQELSPAFKQPPANQTPQKVTLLAQSLSNQQHQSPLPHQQQQQQQQQQLTGPGALQAANQTGHHRSQSYSRAMSLPMVSAKQEIQDAHAFHTTFDNGLEVNTNVASSPIMENPNSPFQKGDSFSSPPLTPNNISSSLQELWSNAPVHSHHHHHHHEHHQHNTESSPTMNRKQSGGQQEGDWAHFSPQTADDVPNTNGGIGVNESSSNVDIPRRRSQTESMASSSMASSVPESTSSIESESESEETVWGITPEQRDYYTNHFKKLQPNEGEVIKGPQARDFFVKSTLPNEMLSKIWNLSDQDKDGALNLDEFCIAMHLVVAVVHGMDLPQTLPPTLFGQDEVQHNMDDVELVDEDVSKLISDEKQDSGEWAAEFDATDGVPFDRNERIQTYAQPSPTSVTVPSETRVHPVSHAPESMHYPPKDYPADEIDTDMTPSSPGLNSSVTYSQRDASGKITAIARPRASANKNVNLMDASPWQLLPPPSGKMAKQQGSGVKKSLNVDSFDSGLDTVDASIESSSNKLVHIETNATGSSEFKSLPTDDSIGDDDESVVPETDRLKVKKKESGYPRNLSKEKSRSIDSLRSDISESSMFEWKRQSIRRESRPRSLTGETLQNDIPQFEGPPVPPPRNKGHVRASSLDFNKVFSSKSPRIGSEAKLQSSSATTPDGSKANRPQKPPRSNPPSNSHSNPSVRPRPYSKSDDYRRSLSCETTLDNDQTSLEIKEPPPKAPSRVKDLSLPSNDAEKTRVNSKEQIVRFMDEPEVLSSSTKSPMEIQMRKHELQARLRDLKNKNSTLSSLISQLGMEWKEVCEERISLEIRLQRAQQELE